MSLSSTVINVHIHGKEEKRTTKYFAFCENHALIIPIIIHVGHFLHTNNSDTLAEMITKDIHTTPYQ